MKIPNIPSMQGPTHGRSATEGGQDTLGRSPESIPLAPAPAPALRAPHDEPALAARSMRPPAVLDRDVRASLAPRVDPGMLARHSAAAPAPQGRPLAASQGMSPHGRDALATASVAAHDLEAAMTRPPGGEEAPVHMLQRPDRGLGELPALREWLSRQATADMLPRATSDEPQDMRDRSSESIPSASADAVPAPRGQAPAAPLDMSLEGRDELTTISVAVRGLEAAMVRLPGGEEAPVHMLQRLDRGLDGLPALRESQGRQGTADIQPRASSDGPQDMRDHFLELIPSATTTASVPADAVLVPQGRAFAPPQVMPSHVRDAPPMEALPEAAVTISATGLPMQVRPSTTDRRSNEEIERTRVLHRPGPDLGLDDLPSLRAGLGRQGTPEQKDQALSYEPALAQAETGLRTYLGLAPGDIRRSQTLGDLRANARDILERADADYETDNIMGVDYESITRQLCILFRNVDE